MNTLNLNTDMIRKSCRIADRFLTENEHLSSIGIYNHYNPRFDGFADIVDAETGFTSFTPFVKIDISGEWGNVLDNAEYSEYRQKYESLNCSYSVDCRFRDLYFKVKNLDHVELVHRVVPTALLDFIKLLKQEFPEQFKTCPMSPKLTRLIGWMFGEKAGGAMDFLTTKAPREDKAGELDEYRIFVSVLPHNVAGMSYYAAKNHGGSKWQGYNGTSCQDPSTCTDPDLINHLPASVMEQSSAVAWLAKRENDNVWEPVYESRSMIRIVPCEKKNLFLICNTYYTSPTVKGILVDGLKNHFSGKMLYAPEIPCRWNCDHTTDIMVNILDCEYSGSRRGECPDCNGSGTVETEHECDCPHCSISYDDAECWTCDGTGESNDDDYNTFLPYLDDTGVIQIESDCITYSLPTDILVSMGAIDGEPTAAELEGIDGEFEGHPVA